MVRTALRSRERNPRIFGNQEVIEKEQRWWPLGKLAQHREGSTKEIGVKPFPSAAAKVARAGPVAAKPK